MLLQLILLGLAVAQDTTAFSADQIKGWQDPRAAILDGAIFLEGGLILDSSGQVQSNENGTFYNISLCDKFDVKDGLSGILNNLDSSYNFPYRYMSGAMASSGKELYVFGGVAITGSNDQTPPIFTWSNDSNQGFTLQSMPSDTVTGHISGNNREVNLSIAYGAIANVPSEESAWYFGGLHAPGYVNMMMTPDPDGSNAASNFSNSLLQIQMGTEGQPQFVNNTNPTDPIARAEGSLSFIPVGTQGTLVAIGGTDFIPYDVSSDSATSGTDFLGNVSLFDIEKNRWYVQETQPKPDGMPARLTAFCTVVKQAPDGASWQIYVYGGYNGEESSTTFDSIWALSLPEFVWTQVVPGAPRDHGRRSHSCFSTTPTTMLSVGGVDVYGSPLSADQTIIDVFDFDNLTWTGIYDPFIKNSAYTVPGMVLSGLKQANPNGGIPSYLNNDVMNLFGVKYPAGKYIPEGTQTCNRIISHSSPAWKYPVIGGVLGGVAFIALISAFCCYRRRNKKKHAQKEADKGNRTSNIWRWVRGLPPTSDAENRIPKSTTSDDSTRVPATFELHDTADYFGRKRLSSTLQEVEGSSHVASPNLSAVHGSPHLLHSPGSPYSNPTELDHRSRSPTSGRESMSFRNFPMHPPSLFDAHGPTQSIWGDTASNTSEIGGPPYYVGTHQSRLATHLEHEAYELSDNRSKERLPNDLEAAESSALVGDKKDKTMSSEAVIRPTHHRHGSSISSTQPNIPSPTPEEDARRSQYLQGLPMGSPVSPGVFSLNSPDGGTNRPFRSAYQENFDDIIQSRRQ